MVRAIFILVSLVLTGALTAFEGRAANLQLGVSVDVIPISSNFDGMDIVVFGTIENHDQKKLDEGQYYVVVEVSGPKEDIVVRRKQRVFGIWMNRHSRRYTDVPSMYFIAADGDMESKIPVSELEKDDLGINNLNLRLVSKGNDTHILPAPNYSNALRSIMKSKGLFSESSNALQYLSPSLFRVAIPLPANVPLGEHTVKAFLFEDGKNIASNTTQFRVSKIGFEQWIYDLAHRNSLIYGIMAVILAISTGWLANVALKKD